jgi:TetR/AcrR family transcriptional regulator
MTATKPGERKLQILQTLAAMLEQPKGEKITTAALAGRLDVSEAALYRHFASKAQMFEGLIEFIESTVFGLINQISTQQEDGLAQAQAIVGMLLNFAERNPGMTRVMIGDALINEDERLQSRMNQFIERIELALKQSLRVAATQGRTDEAGVAARANLLVAMVLGRWQRYAKSGFKQSPSEHAAAQLAIVLS